MSEDNKLDFTGERFTPECVREIWYEHYHRYAFVQKIVKDKKVLDAACGEGYGSHMLSNNASEVIAIDIDQTSVKHAQSKYKNNNLNYINASCIELPFRDDSFDVIVSFETLEHIEQQQEMLNEFNRVLRSEGLLIISTPDKKHYSDASGFVNEYHVKELYKREFKDLLDAHWKAQIWYAQAMVFNSLLEKIDSNEKQYATDILNMDVIDSDSRLLTPMYYVVIAAKNEKQLPHTPDLHLFADQQQSVYKHYDKTIKDYIYLANKHNALIKKHEKWLSLPILGKILKLLNRD